MSPRPTPEERAAERYPTGYDWSYDPMLAEGFATCIRELVEPRDRLIQELVDALVDARITQGNTFDTDRALASAKELGFTPNPHK